MSVPRLIWSIWLFLFSVHSALALSAGTTAKPVYCFDGPEVVRVVSSEYDGPSEGLYGYDETVVRTANECASESLNTRLLASFAEFLAAETTAPNLMYHYTTASESSFANGLWEGSSVTDKLYTDAAQASQELGIPVPNKVIPIQNTGQFVPNAPSVVQQTDRFLGGGNDFVNPQRVPPSQLFPAQPIGPR
jgi:hypothetical protein